MSSKAKSAYTHSICNLIEFLEPIGVWLYMSLKSKILLILNIGICSLFFIFGCRGDFTVVICPTAAVDHHYFFLFLVKWCKHDRTSLPALEIPAPLSSTASSGPHWRWACIGIPLILTHASPDFRVIENLRLDSAMGMNKPAAGWKDAWGWGGKAFLRFHLTWKLG